MANYIGLLKIRVLEAKLEKSCEDYELNPFVCLKLGYERSRSKVKNNVGLNPYWDFKCDLKHPKKYNTLRVRCYTPASIGKTLVGEAYILLDEIIRNKEKDDWYRLTKDNQTIGKIYLEITYSN